MTRSPLKIQVSALMDDELERQEARFLWRGISHDAELKHAWDHYHVLRSCLRGEPTLLASADFADRVVRAAAAESKPVQESRNTSRSGYWLRWSGGGVIAAAVTMFAVMLVPGGVSELSNAPRQELVSESAVPAPSWLHAPTIQVETASDQQILPVSGRSEGRLNRVIGTNQYVVVGGEMDRADMSSYLLMPLPQPPNSSPGSAHH